MERVEAWSPLAERVLEVCEEWDFDFEVVGVVVVCFFFVVVVGVASMNAALKSIAVAAKTTDFETRMNRQLTAFCPS